MATYRKTFYVDSDELATINAFLNATKEDEFQGDFNTICNTVVFDNGLQMDIKCCGCNDEPSWSEVVLFDIHGSELCCSDVDETYVGTWELEYNGDTYIAEVIEEGSK